MRPLKVDFAPVPPWRGRALNVAILVIGLGCIYEGFTIWELRQRIQVKRAELAASSLAIERAEAARREELARAQVPPPYYKDALAIWRMASFPMGAVLASIEVEPVAGVRLTSIDVSAIAEEARIELEFMDHAALARYVDRISEAAAPMSWSLVEARLSSTSGAPGTARLVLRLPNK